MNVSDLDLVALTQALDDHEPDREHYLDLDEGTLWTFVFSESTDETRSRHEQVRAEANGERADGERAWARVPSMTTQEAYEEVEDFVEDVTGDDLRQTLFTALEKKGALRNFREVLMQLPQARQQWSAFRKERSRARVERFLRDLVPGTILATYDPGQRLYFLGTVTSEPEWHP